MNVLLATKDAVFSRMMTLEFAERALDVLTAGNLTEIEAAMNRAHLAMIDVSFLSEGELPKFPFDIILFGYPDELAKISACELTKYYVVTRPFIVEDFFAMLFPPEEYGNPKELRLPKRKSPSESLALDAENRLAFYKGEKISLTQKEFALLQLLYENRGLAVSREFALTEVFGESETKTNVVDVYINYLRAKIDNQFGIRLILTVRGCGYTIPK